MPRVKEHPTWLLAAEHGALGEARAKSLLLERFWVLERSVDVQGADLLIQRRLQGSHLFDRTAPILGRIQAKFVQDGRTPIRIPIQQVIDQEGTAEDFFLLIFSGLGKKQEVFMLTARDIVDHFRLTRDGLRGYFRWRSQKVFDSFQFRVNDPGMALDRIEDELERASFLRNRRFLLRTRLSLVNIDPAHIEADYTIPLENWYGNFRDAFYEMKQRVKDVVNDMEEWATHLHAFLQATDPVQAWSDFDEFFHWHGNDGACTFRFDVGNQDFINAVFQHRQKLDRLRKLGVESAYMKVFATIENFCVADIAHRIPLGTNDIYVVLLGIDPSTLLVKSISSDTRHEAPASSDGFYRTEIVRLEPSMLEVSYDLRWLTDSDLASLVSQDQEKRENYLRRYAWRFIRDPMNWIDENLILETLPEHR